jgi:hypothetical protein
MDNFILPFLITVTGAAIFAVVGLYLIEKFLGK